MEHTKEFLKEQLALQGINASEEDLKQVQRVLGIINDGAKHLEDFTDIEEQSIILTMDLEGTAND